MQKTTERARAALDRIRTRRRAKQTLQEFIDWVDNHPSPVWVFRGQSQQWPIRPSVGRLSSYSLRNESLLFEEFHRSALPHLDRSLLENDWDWLSVAQHHGLPTRLVDWSSNALVAIYFASQASPHAKRDGEVVAVDASAIGYYGADDRSASPFAIEATKFLRPSAVATRIMSQKGLFSVHHEPNKPWRLRERKDTFPVPADQKADLRRLLFAIGVDDAFLMADLDGLARTLKWRAENGALGE